MVDEPYNIQPTVAPNVAPVEKTPAPIVANLDGVAPAKEPAPENGKLVIEQGNKIDANTSILQIDRMIGNLERKGALSHAETLQLHSLRNNKKTMSAERDNKADRPTKEVQERDFKAKQGDLIEYMYDEWILGSLNWCLKKTDKYIRIGANALMDRWSNNYLKDNEAIIDKAEKDGKSSKVAKDNLLIDSITIELVTQAVERLEAQNKHIVDCFTALKDLDPNNPEDVLKIKQMFGEKRGLELANNLSGLDKEKRDEFIDNHINRQENYTLLAKSTLETTGLNLVARTTHNIASDKDFLNGKTPEEIKKHLAENLNKDAQYNIGKAVAETIDLDGADLSSYLEKRDAQARKAYDTSKKNIADGNTWENDKKPENPHLDTNKPYNIANPAVQSQADFAITEITKILNEKNPQETLNKNTLDRSVDLFNATIIVGTHDKTLHMANAVEKLIDEKKEINLEKITKNSENFEKNLEEFSKLDLKNPKEYKKAEDLLGKEVAQKTKNMSNEDKEAYLEKHKERELSHLDMAEKIVEISANGSKGKALHALASDPEIFNKKKDNGEFNQELFETTMSTIYTNNMRDTLYNVNKGIETTLGNKSEIDIYLNKTKENADNCLRVSQENIKNKDNLAEGEKPKNEFYEYDNHKFKKAEKEPEEKVTYMTMKEALEVQNIAADNEKERLALANTSSAILDTRFDIIKEKRKILNLAIERGTDVDGIIRNRPESERLNVTEMTRNEDGSRRTFGGR